MDTIYINENNCRVHRAGEHLLVKRDGRKVMTAPLEGVKSVVVCGSVQFTTQALELFLDRGIDVVFTDLSGQVKGHLAVQKRSGVVVRLAQYALFMDKERRLELAKTIISGKIRNQQTVLLHSRKKDAVGRTRQAAKEMDTALITLDSVHSIDKAMGCEGIAARIYFDAFRSILGRKDFSRREYRPAPDIVNSALNLGYSFLSNEATLALTAVKLDTELGFLHSIHYGRNSLALDLMEEFRAPFVDAWVIRMLNGKILTGNDFEGKEQGYFLTRDGYHKFLEEFHKHAKSVDWRRYIAAQSSKLKAFVLRGEAYEPFEFK